MLNLQVSNYFSPALEELEDFLTYYDDDKIGQATIYAYDGTQVTETITDATSTTAVQLQSDIIKPADFLYAIVEYDSDGTAGTYETTHIYVVVRDQVIVSQATTETEIFQYIFETLLGVATPANLSVALSGTTGVIVSNATLSSSVTATATSSNAVSNSLSLTLSV